MEYLLDEGEGIPLGEKVTIPLESTLVYVVKLNTPCLIYKVYTHVTSPFIHICCMHTYIHINSIGILYTNSYISTPTEHLLSPNGPSHVVCGDRARLTHRRYSGIIAGLRRSCMEGIRYRYYWGRTDTT